MTLKIGSLFSGTGALDMAVAEVFGAETAWFCEFNKHAAKILEHHWPDVPNHCDVSTVDWSKVEPVDIITGGSPCQDLSSAGKRAGMVDGTRSNLWVAMRDAIDALRPTYVVWENVRGALSAKAASESDRGDSERHRLCVCGGIDRRGGEHSHRRDEGEVVRPEDGHRDDEASPKRDDGTSSRVRRDISDHAPGYREMGGGMDVLRSRGGLREASAGRDSVFENQETSRRVGHPSKRDKECAATSDEWPVSVDGSGAGKVPRNQTGSQGAQSQGSRGHCGKCGGCLNEPCADSDLELCDGQVGDGRVNLRALGRVLGDLAEMGYDAQWGVVRASDAGACHRRERVFVLAQNVADAKDEHEYWHPSARFAIHGPADGGCPDGETPGLTLLPTPQARDHKDGEIKPAAHRPQSKDSVNRAIAHLLPTPRSSDSSGPGRHGQGGLDLRTAASLLSAGDTGEAMPSGQWGEYEAAIRRWEQAMGRPAPDPTEPAPKGGVRLSPRFVEWMMGLPDGHVTDPAIGVSRMQQLKALGNGVVPQQAMLALTHLLPTAGGVHATA